MNMNEPLSAMDAIVFVAFAFVAIFTVAWGLSPRMREWIERPKYRFQENVRSYERESK